MNRKIKKVSDLEKLLPCPFCGESRPLYLDRIEFFNNPDEPKYSVMCLTCAAEGPIEDSWENAVLKWNDRFDFSR